MVVLLGGVVGYQYWMVVKQRNDASLLTEAFANIANVTSIKYHAWSMSDGNVGGKNDLWWKQAKGRTQQRSEVHSLADNSVRMIVIGDSASGQMWYLNPDTNVARYRRLTAEQFAAAGWVEDQLATQRNILESLPVIVGREIVNGKECLVVKTKNREMEIKEWKHWIWPEYGIVLKSMSLDQGRSVWVDGVDGVEVNSVLPDALFTLPAGVSLVPMGDADLTE